MKLYLISQGKNLDYDTYDSAVVIAESEEDARLIHPSHGDLIDKVWNETTKSWCYNDNGEVRELWSHIKYGTDDWTAPHHVDVEYLGEAKEGSVRSVVCSSYNAG